MKPAELWIESVQGTPIADRCTTVDFELTETVKAARKPRAEFSATFDGVEITATFESGQQLRDALREILKYMERQ